MKTALSILMTIAVVSAQTPASLDRMSARFVPVDLRADLSSLPPSERRALDKLIEAAAAIDQLFMKQYWSGNHALHAKLKRDRSPLGLARLSYFWLNKGPWSDLDGHTAFLPDVPAHKPAGAEFYPADMTKAEFESWVKTLDPAGKQQAESFFTTIRRDQSGKLTAVPYPREYAADLRGLASLLRQAASASANPSLRRYLETRAAAFLSNDYYESDVAWMELDSDVDVTIGPYETYNDELFGYKASFEAYICLRDAAETAKLKFFAGRLQEIEDNLPIDPKHRNPKLGALAPITVVNQLVSAGDGAHGIATAAFNLPNDERVVTEKGAKRVMLKNVQEAKFEKILTPLAARVLAPASQSKLAFDSFFTHILAHELSHGLGPQKNVRQALRNHHSGLEEAKADILGLFVLQYLMDKGHLPRDEERMYTTFLASTFRTLRFGIKEAHGRGMAIQFNRLTDAGAFIAQPDGTFTVDIGKAKSAVRALAGEIMTIQAEGNFAAAEKLVTSEAVIREPLAKALDRLKDLPTDIAPRPPAALVLRSSGK